MHARLSRLAVLAVLAVCTTIAGAAEPTLVWRGDLATSRALMQGLAPAWQRAGHPAMKLEPFSTISGLDAAASGTADLAGSAREAFAKRAQETGLVFTPIAWDGLVLITHRENPVRAVSLGQLNGIYRGKIRNWEELGGPDQPINLYSIASPLDGVEYSLRKYLFRRGNQPVAAPRLYINTKQLEEAVAIDRWGLGATTLSAVHDNARVAMLSVEGVAPSLASIEDGSYPLYQSLYLAHPGVGADAEPDETTRAVLAFIAFATSERGRAALRARHVLPWEDANLLAHDLERHEVAVQDRSAPRRDGPVAAPGATFTARSAVAPTSERTLEARQRLAQQQQREAASAAARASNVAVGEPTEPAAAAGSDE